MKPYSLLVAAFLTVSASVSLAQSTDGLLLAKNTSSASLPVLPAGPEESAETVTVESKTDAPEVIGQGKSKGKKGKAGRVEKGEGVKEVATAKRQGKPEKVGASLKGSAARPQSAARPVKGVGNGAIKAAGNAARAGKPVKVGGAVGVGVKVRKN